MAWARPLDAAREVRLRAAAGRSRRAVRQPRFLAAFLLLCLASAAFFYASFFLNLNSTLSDWTSAGFAWPMQEFHNFLHGRALQTSLWAKPGGGDTIFIGNPYAYLNATVIHLHLFPYVFAPIWALHPTPAWLYGIIFLWNLAGGSLFSWLILRALSPQDYKTKAMAALGVLWGGGLLNIMDQMAQFLLLCGPLMMAAYYCFLSRRKAWFAVSLAAVCLVSEDAAMAAACFSAYLFFFEPGGGSYGRLGALLSVPYVLSLLLVIQPAASAELSKAAGTTTALVLHHVLDMSPKAFAANLWSLAPVAPFLPAFALAAFVFGTPSKAQLARLACLAAVPALPHWGECLVVGAGHHLMPPFIFTFLALLRMLGDARGGGSRSGRPALAAAGLFFLSSFRVLAGNLPNAVKPALYRLAGKREKAELLERGFQGGAASNREAIAVAHSLPPGAGLSAMVNKTALGFISDRSSLWLFPDLLDRADYLLIQKDATDPIFLFDPAVKDLRAALKAGQRTQRRDIPASPAMADAVRDGLVARERSHEVVVDDAHVLLLRNLSPKPPRSPPTTVGFGFLRYAFRRPLPGELKRDVAW